MSSISSSSIHHKDMRKLVKELEQTGRWVLVSINRHIKIKHVETGRIISVPGSPSDRRSMLNCQKDISRVERGIVTKSGQPVQLFVK